MALATVDPVIGTFVIGDRRAVIADFAFDSSYPTGGESLTPTALGFTSRIEFLLAEPTAGYVFNYDRTNQKLLAYRQKDPAAAGGADIALPQVGNTVDLSALTAVRIFAIGK